MGAGPRAATGMEENGARPPTRQSVAFHQFWFEWCAFLGEMHGAMKNRTLKDWRVEHWKAEKGKFYPHPGSGGVEVNRRHQRAGSRWQERAQGSCSPHLCGLAQMAPGAVLGTQCMLLFFVDFLQNMRFPRAT